jgi:hypothetical protein
MKIISHRGYWKSKEEQNSIVSFKRALKFGFGIETDLRDSCGKIVISHDLPMGSLLTLDNFLEFYLLETQYLECKPFLALNIKSDGLQKELKTSIEKFKIKNYFVFDMSIPDTLGYASIGMPFFTRRSEYEQSTDVFESEDGVWVDQFDTNWADAGTINSIKSVTDKICIVSPELHGRDYLKYWKAIKEVRDNENIMICTDFPGQAQEFFNE